MLFIGLDDVHWIKVFSQDEMEEIKNTLDSNNTEDINVEFPEEMQQFISSIPNTFDIKEIFIHSINQIVHKSFRKN